jgi:hypothetical protein
MHGGRYQPADREILLKGLALFKKFSCPSVRSGSFRRGTGTRSLKTHFEGPLANQALKGLWFYQLAWGDRNAHLLPSIFPVYRY